MVIAEFTPILVSVYNRKTHLVRLIESLKKNKQAKNSLLYVASDAPCTENDVQSIEDIRKYIRSFDGFLDVILLERKQNLGSHRSIISAIDEVFDKHDKLIFLEDDNFVSENFLSFMNNALNHYATTDSIFSISGYNYPVDMPKEYTLPIYLYKGFSAWGVGLWKIKWNEINWDINFDKIRMDLHSNNKMIKYNLGDRVYRSIKHMCKNNVIYADALICYYLYKTNKFSVFPVISKVRNYGHDGMGEHGGYSCIYLNQNIDDSNNELLLPDKLTINKRLTNRVKRYFNLTKTKKLKDLLKHFYLVINDRIQRRVNNI